MEPSIQYAKTTDGADIAYWALGAGAPFIYMSAFPFSHIQLEWENPERRAMYQHWIEKTRFVRYDSRGIGLSGRFDGKYSMDTHFRDLDAVAEKVGAGPFVLLAFLHQAPVAIAYATRYPERVTHLLLWCGYARGKDWEVSAIGRATRALLEADWHTYTETAPHLIAGWSEPDQGRRMAALIRESLTPETTTRVLDSGQDADVTSILPEVTTPTLVLHRRALRWPTLEVARELATGVQNGRLVLLEGSSGGLHVGDTSAVYRAVDDFLGLPPGEKAQGGESSPAPFQTILFTDVEGSTALTDRLGDAAAREVLREHERVTREALKAHGGSEVKTMGDGFMASFGSATKALECAIAIQLAFDATSDLPSPVHGRGTSAEGGLGEGIRVRCGLNAGEPIAEDDDLFGTAVIVAARIAAQAHGGEILVSDVVRQLVAGKGFLFNDRGEHALKGFEDPVRVFEVSWRK
jgi:class 3 adenylate cyclase